MLFLRQANAEVSFYIPDRADEGYGLNTGALAEIAEQGVTLVITVDCGVSDVEAVSYANSKGMDIIVTDHHEVPENIAPAYAILNPKQARLRLSFQVSGRRWGGF